MKYGEMFRLKSMLDEEGIPYEFKDESGEYAGRWLDMKIPSRDLFVLSGRGFSVVFSKYSSGYEKGLLEMWNRPREYSPKGYMTAEEVFHEIIHSEFYKEWKERKEEV